MSNTTPVPTPLFERANIDAYVRVAREKNRSWIIDPGSGRSIDINTPILEISEMRNAAIHRSANRYESNSKFRDAGLSICDGIIRSRCGESISAILLQRMDNEDLNFQDTISKDFPTEDPVSWGGLHVPVVEAPPDNDTPTSSVVGEMESLDNGGIDSDDG